MGGENPGPYSSIRHPWVPQLHDVTAPACWVMKGAQTGVSEVAINRAFYALLQERRNVLYVFPTAVSASDFSRSRFGAALSESPLIRQEFTDTNSVGLKQAGSASLYIRGSRGKDSLVSVPASLLILDEFDRMKEETLSLAVERTSGQLRKEIFGISTPRLPDKGIHKQFKLSTQEHFTFKCPSCSKQIRLIWPDSVQIVGDDPSDPQVHKSYLKCTECGAKLPQELKPEFLKNATWVSDNPHGNPDIRGFHISQLYSYTVTPGELVEAYLRGYGDEFQTVEFHNSKLGLPFIATDARITDTMLEAALQAGGHSTEDLRPTFGGERIVTMGVDQGKTGYIVICEWTLNGSPGYDVHDVAKCKVLFATRYDEEDWGRLDELMSEWQVLGCVVDADPNINEARRFARRFPRFVKLCRYRQGPVQSQVHEKDDDTGAPILHVDWVHWMSTVHRRFKTNPTTIALPRDIPTQFKDHIKNVARTYERDDSGNPQMTFESLGADHFCHALLYAHVALQMATSMESNAVIRNY